MGLKSRTTKTRKTQGMAAFHDRTDRIVIAPWFTFLGLYALYQSVRMAQLAVRDFRESGFCVVGYLRVLGATGFGVIGLSCILGTVWCFFLRRGKR